MISLDRWRRAHRRDLWCVVFLVCVTIASCLPLLTKYPSPGGDEPGFVDVAVNVMTRGVVGTPAYEGLLPGAESHVYWQPPLYFLGLAGWFATVGVGLVQARTFSMVWAVTIVILVYAMARRHAAPTPSLIAAVLLAVSYWLTNRADVARMDAMCIALTFASILIYQYAHDRARLPLFGLSGLLAGLAFLTHPLGIVAITTLATHLVVSERRGLLRTPRTYVVFACFTVPMAGWLGFVLQDFDSFRLQMGAQLARKQQLGSYWHQFWMARTHAISLVVVLGAAVWLSVASLRKTAELLIPMAFVYSFAASTYGRETGYFSYFYPWACCALAILLDRLSQGRLLAQAAVLLALVNELAVLGHDIYRYRQRDYSALTRAVRDVVPLGSTVFLGPSEVSPYFALLGRNPMRIFVPTPTTDPQAHRRAAEACDFIAVTVPVTYLPDVNTLVASATPLVVTNQGPGYRMAIYESRAARRRRPR
jgi:4-amino-4-deoxy-L-arabinose transferase-like glycosyltransferase